MARKTYERMLSVREVRNLAAKAAATSLKLPHARRKNNATIHIARTPNRVTKFRSSLTGAL
jgi:hypothetical protein